jgi:hypothetical protein
VREGAGKLLLLVQFTCYYLSNFLLTVPLITFLPLSVHVREGAGKLLLLVQFTLTRSPERQTKKNIDMNVKETVRPVTIAELTGCIY